MSQLGDFRQEAKYEERGTKVGLGIDLVYPSAGCSSLKSSKGVY